MSDARSWQPIGGWGQPAPDEHDFMDGGGEMSALMRSLDWAGTPLGPVALWPPSLRISVSTCLGSRFPILLWWGPELVMLYNDAYRIIIGSKHPRALGQPGRECWPEVWDIIGPMLQGVRDRGEATWSENLMLPLQRSGYSEECYFTFSYSPIRGEGGRVAGVFCAVKETTPEVIGERRLRMLRALAASATGASGVDATCQRAMNVIAGDQADIPFALLYLVDGTGDTARLVASAGVDSNDPGLASVARLDAGEAGNTTWPLAKVAASEKPQLVENLATFFSSVPPGPWPEPPGQALVLPVRSGASSSPAAFLVAGVSVRRALDEQYLGFLDLTAAHLSTAIASARAYEEERQRAEALAELDRAKTNFFSNVSHEFRTPLTLMLGPLDDLLSNPGALPPDDLEALTVVHRNGQRLLKLVNTLLDFSRIEAGRVRAAFEPVDLSVFTADLASVFRSAIEKAGLSLRIDCPPLPEPVFVDREMWEKIVLNLLSNAFKFTFEGEVEVSLRAEQGFAVLKVRDTGTGIPESELPRLFNRFYRIHDARGRSSEGTGIGLALAQELARLHGGTVEATSVVGAGSTFTVRIPLGRRHLPADRIVQAPARAPEFLNSSTFLDEALRSLPDAQGEDPFAAVQSHAAVHAPRTATGARILVADDNADMRKYLRRLLAEEYEVATVGDGVQALAAVTREPFDLVVADVMMPKLNGFGLLKALRDNPRTKALPVIMLSARAGEEARVEGLQAGADDYLIKPFSARELLARVDSHLKLARLRREAAAELAAVNARLQEADRRKDEFLAMLAHELRNPLAVMSGAARILKAQGLNDPGARRAREAMERQARHMERLIDDLLDVSRVTRGKVSLKKETVDLARVVDAAVEAVEPQVAARGQRLVVSPTRELLLLDADAVRLVQVVSNILNNASNYTPAGGEIHLAAERRDGQALVRVRDTGDGIDPALLPHVFDLFVQGDRAPDRAQGGLGIGLTMARSLAEMHGGSIEARSEGHGRGSEFVLRLPLLEQSTPDIEEPAQEDEPVPPRRILVVDDNADAVDMMRAVLEMEGHEVFTATSGDAAVEMALRHVPHLALIDLGMPGADGFEVVRRLRGEASLRQTVLVALSGYGQEEVVREARLAGFDHHLVKPADFDKLRELLRGVSAGRGR